MDITPQTALIEDVRAGEGLTIRRKFTSPGVHPFETVQWETRDARIGSREARRLRLSGARAAAAGPTLRGVAQALAGAGFHPVSLAYFPVRRNDD